MKGSGRQDRFAGERIDRQEIWNGRCGWPDGDDISVKLAAGPARAIQAER